MQDACTGIDPEYLDYCRKVLTGRILEKNGRPITELNRLQCLHVLNQHIAKSKRATTLFSFINGLHVTDKTRHQVEHGSIYVPLMDRQAERAFVDVARTDIISGRLVVRDPVHLLRQNETPDVQAVMSDPDHPDWFSLSVRLVVKRDEARAWLQWQGRPIPDWLKEKKVASGGKIVGEISQRAYDAMELMLRLAILEYGYDPERRRNDATGFIFRDVQRVFDIDKGTVSTWLKRASGLKHPQKNKEIPNSIQKIILGMVESRFQGNVDQRAIAIARNLEREQWPHVIDKQSIASIIEEAMILPRKNSPKWEK